MRFESKARQARYEQLLAVNHDPELSFKLASWAKLPGEPGGGFGVTGTERPVTGWLGTGDPLAGVAGDAREYVRAQLAARGATDLSGKRYMPGLAAFVGDPEALVSTRSDIQNVCERRGYGAEGLCKARVRERSVPCSHECGEYTVSEKSVNDRLAGLYNDHPELQRKHTKNPAEQKRFVESLAERLSGRGSDEFLKAEGIEAV